MLNLQPNSTNNLIIYADTVTDSIGNFFTIIFTNTYSKQTFAVVPQVVRRNGRFVELEVTTVGVDGLDQPLDGEIYLYPAGNFTYTVFHTNGPTITLESPLQCAIWNTEEEFWNFANTVWNVCEIEYEIIDRGQAFLYADTNACEREVEFVPYTQGNNILDAIVYVTNVPLFQFPCTIPFPEDYVVEVDTTTYCQTITIETGASLTVSGNAVLTQTGAPYGYC